MIEERQIIDQVKEVNFRYGWYLLIVLIAVLLVNVIALPFNNYANASVAAALTAKGVDSKTPARGLFYDRNDKRLVSNLLSYNLLVNADAYAGIRLRVGQILGRPELTTKDGVRVSEQELRLPHVLSNDDKIKLISQLEQNEIEKIRLIEIPQRYYEYPQELAHIIGYTALASETDINNGYSADDQVGRYGLEKLFEQELKGIKVNDYASKYGTISNQYLAGNNIFLTINADWQKQLYKILSYEADVNSALGAAAVVIEADTGDIVSLVNYPSFNPTAFASGISQVDYDKLVNDPRQPILNKAVAWQAPPGSTFKLFSTYSLLKNDAIVPANRVNSTGCMPLSRNAKFCEIDNRPLGSVNLVDALYRSSNIYFCQSMLKLDAKVGIETVINDVKVFGFGSKLNSQFTEEIPGLIAAKDYKRRVFNDSWFDGDSCNMAIGQGYTLVTPLQLAYGVNTLMNGGRLLQPNLVKFVKDTSGTVVAQGTNKVISTITIPDQTKQILEQAMRLTVDNPRGSAYLLSRQPKEFNLRVKTGSTEAKEVIQGKLKQGTHSWVVMLFDYQGRTYTMVVFQRFGGRSSRSLQTINKFLSCVSNPNNSFC
jgi:penicillin-binding protein 2